VRPGWPLWSGGLAVRLGWLSASHSLGLGLASREPPSAPHALTHAPPVPPGSIRAHAGAATASLMSSAGALGPIFNPLDLTFRSTAGAGVIYWAGSLYALSQVGHRWQKQRQGVPHPLSIPSYSHTPFLSLYLSFVSFSLAPRPTNLLLLSSFDLLPCRSPLPATLSHSPHFLPPLSHSPPPACFAL
jgi:hypothetical protein